jgi:hypothetical protein
MLGFVPHPTLRPFDICWVAIEPQPNLRRYRALFIVAAKMEYQKIPIAQQMAFIIYKT